MLLLKSESMADCIALMLKFKYGVSLASKFTLSFSHRRLYLVSEGRIDARQHLSGNIHTLMAIVDATSSEALRKVSTQA